MRPARHSPTRRAKASHISSSPAAKAGQGAGQGRAPLQPGAFPARRPGPARSVIRQAETSSAPTGNAPGARKGDTIRARKGETDCAPKGAPLRPTRGERTRAQGGARTDESPR